MSECPSDLAMSAVYLGEASRAEIIAIHDHGLSCARCREALAAIARARHNELSELAIGRRVGRFVIERELGRGGMGVVYAATDEVLDRTVAVKLLDHRVARPAHTLLAEARAMARVDHPNVVSVLEVSTQAGKVYLAMELVDGPHLGTWLADQRPDRATIIETFLGAGRGLAAIHAAGLVHRDFKPHNVLVGADGRARVTDFGLVRSLDAYLPEHEADLRSDGGAASTRIRGTPRYMAPEQVEGGSVDERADQFSFCASLYEALAGVPPHGDGPLRERLQAIERGHLSAPRPGRSIPGAVLRVLRHGLRREPTSRHADMTELCRALATANGRRARLARVTLGSAGALCALGLGLVLASAPTRCPTEATARGEVAPATLLDAVQQSAPPTAVAAVERYVDAWARARVAACDAGPMRAEVSDQTYDAMMNCLHTSRLALASVVADAAEAPNVAAELGSVVRGLASPLECSDVASARVDQRLDSPEDDQAYNAVAAEFAKAVAFVGAELVAEARATVDAVAPRVRAGGWPAITAQQNAVLAEIAMAEGDVSSALELWRDAYAAALVAGGSGGQWREVVLGGVKLHTLAGNHPAAEDLLLRLEAVQRRDALPGFDIRLALQRALLEIGKRDMKAAESSLHRVIELAEGHDSSLQAYGLACGNLAVLLCRTGRCAEGLPWFRRSIDSYVAALGPDAADVLGQQSNLGAVLTHMARFGEARTVLTRALDSATEAGLHTVEATAALRLARVERETGDHEAALVQDRRAAQIYAHRLREGDPRIADSRLRVGRDLLDLDRADDAIEELEAAAAIAHWDAEEVAGLAPVVNGELARALAAENRVDEAVELIESTQARVEADATMKTARGVSRFYACAAEVYERANRSRDMLAAAQRAEKLLQGRDVPRNEQDAVRELVERAAARARTEPSR